MLQELPPKKRGRKPGTHMSPLKKRAEWLVKRGFDVPPSKEDDYRTLRAAGYTMAEIKEMLNLE